MQLFSSWTGSDFLLFYAGLIGLACLAAWWIPAHLRSPGRGAVPDDLDSIAMLAGGRARLADALLADLFVRGGLVPEGKGRLAVADAGLAATPAGRTLLATGAPVTLAQARKALDPHARRITVRLQRAGLLLRREDCVRLRWLAITPFVAVLVFGLYRQRAGSAMGEPTGVLLTLLALLVVLAIARFVRCDTRTRAGLRVARQLRDRHGHLSHAPRAEEAGMAVALFGTGVLAGRSWEAFHALRRNQAGDSTDAGSDAGEGSGGCGG